MKKNGNATLLTLTIVCITLIGTLLFCVFLDSRIAWIVAFSACLAILVIVLVIAEIASPGSTGRLLPSLKEITRSIRIQSRQLQGDGTTVAMPSKQTEQQTDQSCGDNMG